MTRVSVLMALFLSSLTFGCMCFCLLSLSLCIMLYFVSGFVLSLLCSLIYLFCFMFPDMQQRRIPTSSASASAEFVMPPTSASSGHSMPPGAVGSSTRDRPPVYNYNRLTEQALLRSAARENQPHLHPKKANGALW